MADPILVTGGTGRLGPALVSRLAAAGNAVRVLSRVPSPKEWRFQGDLLTGEGLEAALDGVGTVVHCATSNGRKDVDITRNLIRAAARAGRPHLCYASIVGVDRVNLPYYRVKRACERLVEHSGLPWTIQRTTQFHELVVWICAVQRRLPVILVPRGVDLQPVDAGEVAARLTGLAGAPPSGRVPDMGGPEIRPLADLARACARSRSLRRPVAPVPMAGFGMRGFREGAHLTPGHADGRITFDQFLAA
ncbi:SDR family oxidoreductase [Glycomyces tenuis]|uniref:SDR family oxidoreductase n=1 Tax=Glycomyces tenuis TaxID=58116 RepID=UPI000409636A|nr:NAD(P)H-binding protein [Glycomyces tenuis]